MHFGIFQPFSTPPFCFGFVMCRFPPPLSTESQDWQESQLKELPPSSSVNKMCVCYSFRLWFRGERKHTHSADVQKQKNSHSLFRSNHFLVFIISWPIPSTPLVLPHDHLNALSLFAINRCLNSLLPKNSQSSTVMVIERFPTASHTQIERKIKISGLTVRRSVDFIIVLRIGIGTTGS